MEKVILNAESSREFDKMLEDISETDRSIVLLRCREELSWREVANAMSLTETAVRKRFERIRKRLMGMKGETTDGRI